MARYAITKSYSQNRSYRYSGSVRTKSPSRSPKSGLLYRAKRGVKRYRKTKKEIENLSQANLAGKKPSHAVREAKSHYVKVKRDYRKARQNARISRKSYKEDPSQTNKNQWKNHKRLAQQSKRTKKIHKKVLKRAVTANGGSLRYKMFKAGTYQLKESSKRSLERTLEDEDFFEEAIELKRKTQRNIRTVKQVGQTVKWTGKATYRLGTYAGRQGLKLGRYASKPVTYAGKKLGSYASKQVSRYQKSVATKWKKSRMGRVTNRFRRSLVQRGQTRKVVSQVFQKGTVTALKILANPFSLIVMGMLLLSVLLMSLVTSTVKQDEFDLTASWVYLSKIDRDKSTATVDYWTDLDSIMTYMNFKHEDYTLDSTYQEGSTKMTYKEFLEKLWEELNQDPKKLKSMKQLYDPKNGHPRYQLTEDELEEFEASLEAGNYINLQELDNPFYLPDDSSYEKPLTVTKRYGYDGNNQLFEGISVMTPSTVQSLYAIMDGKVSLGDQSITIETEAARVILEGVEDIKVTNGQAVKTGDLLGRVSGSQLIIRYQKLWEDPSDLLDREDWHAVNPGFYLPSVTYNQRTTVKVSSKGASGSVRGRISQIWNQVLEYEPKATKEGVASMLGNFWTESDITAKRAEGDYLAPPIGASDGSWDDPSWLEINGPTIYNGAYDNIIHRGLGLGQWTDTKDGSVRHTLLRNYAKEKGKNWYDLDLQIDFMFNGDAPYYRQTLRRILTSTGDVADLTQDFLLNWEGNAGDKLPARIENARKALDILNNPSPMGDGQGGHIFATPYVVLQEYGYTAWSTGAGAYLYAASGGKHTGVDVQAYGYETQDIPVLSMTNGRVYSVSYSDLGGHAITIEPDFGGYLYYGHLKYAPSLTAGQEVTIGQEIAVLGNSGMTTIYHVHLEYSSSPLISTGLYDSDPSFLFQKEGTLQQGQVFNP